MKRIITLLVFALLINGLGYAQDENAPEKKKKDRPVREMYGSSLIIDEQSPHIGPKKSLEMQIQHRFGLIKNNGISDLFGIYAPSANTRMGLNYAIRDNLEVGYGITRINMVSDFQVKWNVLRQTRKDQMPLTVTLYGNMGIDGQNKDVYTTATADSAYKFTNRLSYFAQVIASRKFTDWFSFGVTGSFSHYNTVKADTVGVRGMDHDRIGISFQARFKFSPQSSIVILYAIPLDIKGINENTTVTNSPMQNFGVAYEVATASHSFQVFFTAANGIVPQSDYLFNTSDWTAGEFRFGFNITRLWEF